MIPPQPSALTRLWPVARVAILVWLGLLAFLALTQRSMIYYPSKNHAAALEEEATSQGFQAWKNPQDETIGYQSLADPRDPRTPVAMVIFHGNAGYALHRSDYASLLRAAAPDHAVSLYILEYPGYGARSGSPSQESFLVAAQAALDNIPQDIPLILLGESIGTGVATATASAIPDRIAGLLLLTPFDNLANVAQHHYPLLPVRWILRDQYPSADWLENYQGPVVIILAARDTVVPAKFGQKLHDNYAGPKLLLIADQADHNDLLHALPESTWREALQFLLLVPRHSLPRPPVGPAGSAGRSPSLKFPTQVSALPSASHPLPSPLDPKRIPAAVPPPTRRTGLHVGRGRIQKRRVFVVEAAELQPGNLHPDETLNRFDHGQVLRRHESEGIPHGLRPPRPADAVHIILRMPRDVIVDHVGNPRDIQPAGCDIRRDENLVTTILETLQRLLTLALRAIGMQGHHRVIFFLQLTGNTVRPVLRPAKDQDAIEICFLHQPGKQIILLVHPHRIKGMRDRLGW